MPRMSNALATSLQGADTRGLAFCLAPSTDVRREIGDLRVSRPPLLIGPAFVSARVLVRWLPNCPAHAARSRARVSDRCC